jgi:hypothetical protein
MPITDHDHTIRGDQTIVMPIHPDDVETQALLDAHVPLPIPGPSTVIHVCGDDCSAPTTRMATYNGEPKTKPATITLSSKGIPVREASADGKVRLPIHAYGGFVPRPSPTCTLRHHQAEPVLMPEPGRPTRLVLGWQPTELTLADRLELVVQELVAILSAQGLDHRPDVCHRIVRALSEVEAAASLAE